ncbi:MAG: hypothetical protein LAO77_25585 [Acidobacteriia bacterium]|nr:hypothetical protein [Terriglobia bacterium]
MALNPVHCSVLHATVTCETDLEGEVTRVICPEYEEPTGICRLKRSVEESGPLGQLLERVSEESLAAPGPMCVLRAA